MRRLTMMVMVVVVMVMGCADGQQLERNFDVITRGELVGGGEQSANQGSRIGIEPREGGADGLTGGVVFPAVPLALTYLPPVKEPLPIEGSEGAGETHTPSHTLLNQQQQQQQQHHQQNTHFQVTHETDEGVIGEDVNAGHHHHHHQEQHQQPGQDQDQDLPHIVPGVIPIPVVEEEEEPTFFSKVGESKLALIGGVMGAKSAVLDGLRGAKESLVSGIKSAVTAKTEAITALTKSSPFSHADKGITANAPKGSGVVQGTSGVVVPYPIYPPYQKPNPNTPYQVYKGAYHQPKPYVVYQAYPYRYQARPSPLETLKAKVQGFVDAKKAVVEGALAKVEQAKAEIDAKIKAAFYKPAQDKPLDEKPLEHQEFYPFRPYLNVPKPHPKPFIHESPYPDPVYPDPKPLPPPKPYPSYPAPESPTPVKPYPAYPATKPHPKPYPAPVHPVPKPYPIPAYPAPIQHPTTQPHTQPQPSTEETDLSPEPRPVPNYRPLYAVYPVHASSTGGIKEKFEAKKNAVVGAIKGAIAKLKAPFQYFQPSYAYYYPSEQW